MHFEKTEFSTSASDFNNYMDPTLKINRALQRFLLEIE